MPWCGNWRGGSQHGQGCGLEDHLWFDGLRGATMLVSIMTLLVITLVLFFSGLSIVELVVMPWSKLVSGDYFLSLSFGVAVCVFMCSCAEISISETKESDINCWVGRKTENGTRVETKLQKFIKNYAKLVTGNAAIFNPVIILTNTTILVIYMTILIPIYVIHTEDMAVIDILGFTKINTNLSQSDAFSGIGVTMVLFLAAELIPKQIALKHKMFCVIYTSWWLGFISILFFVPAYCHRHDKSCLWRMAKCFRRP
jgi:Cyclin M transmembrane N-terminal domain